MSWIKMISYEESDGELREQFEPLQYAPGKIDHILQIHSLIPSSITSHHEFYRDIMFKPSDLSRKERELIATVVSIINECHY